jgi:hypothetical protein
MTGPYASLFIRHSQMGIIEIVARATTWMENPPDGCKKGLNANKRITD